MTLPLVVVPETRSATRFQQHCDHLCDRHRELWLSTGDSVPQIGVPTSRLRQWRNARATRSLIDRLAVEIRDYPEAESDRLRWRDDLRETISRFGEERLGWPAGYRQLLFADAVYHTTVRFSRGARAFDPELRTEELMQALRNVWIMNSLQMLLDLEVRFTPSVFAYSMLYPCTDNLLDDPLLPMADKRSFNERLGKRLHGERVAPKSDAEQSVWRLLDRIENQYPRAANPEVWYSLQEIHRGQVDSLRQQTGRHDDLLAISVAKGGASVLADGYLVAGRLEPDEADFCFGYGVFLQLLDDLQDAETDRRAGHDTLFSTAQRPLDRLVSRLYRFMHRVVDESRGFQEDGYVTRRDLILRNCTMLLVGAVAEEPRLFSRTFRRALERCWPLRFRAMRRLRPCAEGRLRSAAVALQSRTGARSLFDLLRFAI